MKYDEFIKDFNPEQNIIYIYALCEPNNDDYIRYIGKSKQIIKRIIRHIQYDRLTSETHKNNWLRILKNNNEKPNVIIIDICNESDWEEKERYWISYYRKMFENLTNIARGGEGGGYRQSKEVIEKRASKRRGTKATPETIEKLRISHLGKNISEETKRKMSESQKLSFANRSPEQIEREKEIYRIAGENKRGKSTSRGLKLNKNSFSKYVGVSRNGESKTKPFRAWITVNNKVLSLKTHKTEEDAARAYNEAALLYFGPDAILNIIE